MGANLVLTSIGQVRKDRLEKKRKRGDVDDAEFVLLEIGREQPISMDRFLLHMKELGMDSNYVRDLVMDWHFAGYVS